MHYFLLSVGSNTYAKRNIEKAKQLLQENISGLTFTNCMESKPYGKQYKRPFLNILAWSSSELSKEEVVRVTKSIEVQMGRKPEDKALGRVVVDIDLIQYGNDVLKPTDFQRSYVKELLPLVNV